jgi:hypothetical protein
MINNDEYGSHDSLVMAALEDLDGETRASWATASHAFTERARQAAKAKANGIRVAPLYRRTLSELYAWEADRRGEMNDPAAPAWQALAQSAALMESLSKREREIAD